ncbi:hypothetical protein HUG17_0461 [Dermatophagoides farinae]|uniref:Zinc finger PHD-type domain-containing protein n=1 Tax=Dermatophagoides farinae TaxID=6954 RepID=A0A9D4P6R3_DERFA|nr:hypothetical protein HUG17_0461 [Dermatophagoides farinae]
MDKNSVQSSQSKLAKYRKYFGKKNSGISILKPENQITKSQMVIMQGTSGVDVRIFPLPDYSKTIGDNFNKSEIKSSNVIEIKKSVRFQHEAASEQKASNITNANDPFDDWDSDTENFSVFDPDGETYCFCRRYIPGSTLIYCDNSLCKIKYFHKKCLNFDQIPDGNFFCTSCKIKKQAKNGQFILDPDAEQQE